MYENTENTTNNYNYDNNTTGFNTNTTTFDAQTVPNVMTDGEPTTNTRIYVQGSDMFPEQLEKGNVPPLTQTIFAVYVDETQFEIPDKAMRRDFVRKIFTILLLQNIISLPVTEIFILCFDMLLSIQVHMVITTLAFVVFSLMYVFSDERRHSPMNAIGLAVVTIFWVLFDASTIAIYSTFSHLAILTQLVVIIEIICMIMYTKQDKVKFSNINSIIFITIIYVTHVILVTTFSYFYLFPTSSFFYMIYAVYDIHLMLTGQHGYNLQPHEYIFAATNIYADMPSLVWRMWRDIVWAGLVKTYRFFIRCCFAEVC